MDRRPGPALLCAVGLAVCLPKVPNDRRDAGLILGLLLRREFPQVHRPPFESREMLRLLRYRHKLVQMRTRAKNSLQALAFSAGSAGSSRLLGREGRERFLRSVA